MELPSAQNKIFSSQLKLLVPFLLLKLGSALLVSLARFLGELRQFVLTKKTAPTTRAASQVDGTQSDGAFVKNAVRWAISTPQPI